jgi:hypothetical protein
MDWTKTSKLIATATGIITITGSLFFVYNFFAKQSAQDALAAEVKENYVRQDDLVAMNKNVQQTNYEFWIYKTNQDINKLYAELRLESDPIKQQQIRDQIEKLKNDLRRYEDKLNSLKD